MFSLFLRFQQLAWHFYTLELPPHIKYLNRSFSFFNVCNFRTMELIRGLLYCELGIYVNSLDLNVAISKGSTLIILEIVMLLSWRMFNDRIHILRNEKLNVYKVSLSKLNKLYQQVKKNFHTLFKFVLFQCEHRCFHIKLV